jgi:hypothetical protein
VVQLACSWRLHAGCDAMISAAFYGANGGARLSNVNGSFYDFTAERYRGTSRETSRRRPTTGADAPRPIGRGASPPASASIRRRALRRRARVLDRIYGR